MKQEDFEVGKLQLKYHSRNPVYIRLVNEFNLKVNSCFNRIRGINDKVHKILEIGVGEGQITQLSLEVFPNAEYCCADIARGILNVAKANLSGYDNQIQFSIQDITQLEFEDNAFDLVICCEVLEHVPNYQAGLRELNRVLKPSGLAIVSVPNEPLWRICNMLRLCYWKNLGNTPGHVNNWIHQYRGLSFFSKISDRTTVF